MFNGHSRYHRTVIDSDTAERLGVLADMEIDESEGRVTKLIIQRRAGFFGRIMHIGEMILPWSTVTAVGEEFILVRCSDGISTYIEET